MVCRLAQTSTRNHAAGFGGKAAKADDQAGINWIVATANESEKVGVEQVFASVL